MAFTVTHAAVISCGSIGASWAALFAAYGITTQVYDPNPAAKEFLEMIVDEACQALQLLDGGHEHDLATVISRISFTTNLECALKDAMFVQENGPENLDIKSNLLRTLDQLLDATVPIMSSTSGLTCTSMQTALTRFPERFAVGHPFNPPHLIPLVEIVGGNKTAPETLEKARLFYDSLGRKPVILKHEIPGHIANRLQSALLREVMLIMKEDIASVADIETAMQFGPGLRWGVMGPSVLMHLGGGLGGAKYYAEKLLGPLLMWTAPGELLLQDDVRKKWVKQTLEVVGDATYLELSRQRDAGIVNTLQWRKRMLDRKAS